ncbi:MAG TPA: hypothetical protein VGX25_15070 [Actinophytocola sp.]|uniref:hypothetical protein n=1 Tax=Actinophytocola sp. TaxID=1872138 RepID=UPI002DDCEBD8|nr:hypothetical protein [Actinophytocola sp.]HEV2780709.1 hypothetical protein [Actinophytocola sp.]
MNFEMPMATAAMNNAVAYADVDEGSECWDVIGAPLDQGVDHTLVDYDNKLELNLQPKPGAKRQEVCDLRWGKIEKDAARLEGLAAAIENISSVVKKGKDQLAHEWKGESFDAFRASIEKVEQVLNEYAKAAKATGQGFRDAMRAARTLYERYRDNSTSILRFDGMAPPNDWWKMSEDSGEHLANNCNSSHAWECTYNNDQQQGVINGKLVNNRLFNQLESWDCTDNPGVSLSQYRDTVRWAGEEKRAIQDKIHEWYVATDRLKEDVGQLHTAALDNLQVMAERKVFQSMQTPGAPTGDTGDPGGDPGRGDPGRGDPGGGPGRTDPGGGRGPGDTGGGPGDPGPGSTGSSGAQEPIAQPQPEPQPEPQPGAQRPDETVTVEDGDHKITVTSPDGQGNVQVTVDDGTGTPKTYDLNFGAGTTPSGTPGQESVRPLPYPTDDPQGPTDGSGTGQPGTGGQEPGEAATPIEPGPDGKCVISDPPLTITAERPPGTSDTVVVTVDDGKGNPTTYTLDYSEGTAGTATPIAQPIRAGTGTAEPTPSFGTAEPAPSTPTAPFAGPGPIAGPGTEPVPIAEPAAAGRPIGQDIPAGQDLPVGQSAEPVLQTSTASSQPGDGPATGFGGTGSLGQVGSIGFPGDSPYTHVPPQTAPGEAGLASASESGGQPAQGGMAGGGMPMMAGAGAGAGGGGGDTERAGSQWRTAGDLFDDAYSEPAGRFGGVLESDDQGQRR